MSKYVKFFKKITPFRYPYRLHNRTLAPPIFLDYRKYKPYLQKEFSNKCVYCKKSDLLQDKSAFHVEHYRPKKHFPNLVTNYSNLYYSCAACNRYKSSYWSTQNQAQILNPCDHIMSMHLKFDQAQIVNKTNQGENTINILRLNNEESLKYRKIMKGLIVSLLKLLGQIDPEKKSQEVDNVINQLANLIGEPKSTVKAVLRM